jgi:hypothetical protein
MTLDRGSFPPVTSNKPESFFLNRSSPLFVLAVQINRTPKRKNLTCRQMVPSTQFQVLLTLLSQFFSTFLRSTSPLSVSVSYLGLDEIYHPFYAELPIYATPKHTRDSEQIRRKLQGFHLHWLQFPLEFATGTIVHLPAAQKVHRKQAITHCFPFPLTFSIFVRHY